MSAILSRRRQRRRRWLQTLGGWLLVLSACSGNPSYPVQADKAHETLDKVMSGWMLGQTIEDFKAADPTIVIQDVDWSGGSKLIAYEVLPDPKPVDDNLQAKVRLNLETKDGKKEEKTVTYLVGTAPVLTVFRDMFH